MQKYARDLGYRARTRQLLARAELSAIFTITTHTRFLRPAEDVPELGPSRRSREKVRKEVFTHSSQARITYASDRIFESSSCTWAGLS